MIRVTLPEESMRMKPFGAKGAEISSCVTWDSTAAKTVFVLAPARAKPRRRPLPCRKARREVTVEGEVCCSRSIVAMTLRLRRLLDGRTNALIGTAPADVARHCTVDIG